MDGKISSLPVLLYFLNIRKEITKNKVGGPIPMLRRGGKSNPIPSPHL